MLVRSGARISQHLANYAYASKLVQTLKMATVERSEFDFKYSVSEDKLLKDVSLLETLQFGTTLLSLR